LDVGSEAAKSYPPTAAAKALFPITAARRYGKRREGTELSSGGSDILRTTSMVYLKSFLAGVAALLAVLLLAAGGFIGWGWWRINHRSANEGGMGAVGYDVSSPWIGIPLLIVIGLTFSVGFYWEFRRAKRANRSPQ
jgi:hypothetical protein